MNKDNKDQKRLILTASIGQCVHVAGIFNFMNIAENMGYKCLFLGPATSLDTILNEISKLNPDIIGLSYRLTPKTVIPILEEFTKKYQILPVKPRKIFFAGTPDVVRIAKNYEIFDYFFSGEESKFQLISILKHYEEKDVKSPEIPMDLISRIKWKKPFPIIRAHFGLPDFIKTIEGIREIANSEVLDVISIAPDQNTQANYFHPEDRIEEFSGAGGVPLHNREDFIKLHTARLTGNKPLLRIYAGTRDFIDLAKLYRDTIQNAWAAIPIFWFNQMDKRGPLSLNESIKQHLEAIKWHGENNIPVEINDSHHWSLRDAPDAIAVADMFLSGIIAKNLGVKNFIAQYMFNTPSSSSLDMDLAKILAKNELLNTLVDEKFNIIKQVRTGLASFPLDLNKAKGQLASATMIQLSVNPDIVHVVSFSEANHAANPEEIIESCKIIDQVINNYYSSKIHFVSDSILKRKEELMNQARWIVNLIPDLAKTSDKEKNHYINHNILERLVKYGIFDAPHLKNNPYVLGKIKTKIVNGACYSWDPEYNKIQDEIERIKDIFEKIPNLNIPNEKYHDEKNIIEVFEK